MKKNNKDIIRVWLYLVLIIICAFFLVGQIKYIQDFSANERDMISKSPYGENILGVDVKLILTDYEVTPITKTDITNLLITVINVNILILCITILLIDILRIAKNE